MAEVTWVTCNQPLWEETLNDQLKEFRWDIHCFSPWPAYRTINPCSVQDRGFSWKVSGKSEFESYFFSKCKRTKSCDSKSYIQLLLIIMNKQLQVEFTATTQFQVTWLPRPPRCLSPSPDVQPLEFDPLERQPLGATCCQDTWQSNAEHKPQPPSDVKHHNTNLPRGHWVATVLCF